MGLPRSIIKKYGVSKKAWAVYRGQKTTTTKRIGGSMAKRTRRKHSYGLGGGKSDLLYLAAGAAVYGAVREKVSDAIAPITSKIPLGNISDELVLGTAGYFAARGTFGKNPMIKNLGKAVMTIEAARIGATIANGELNMGGASSSSMNGNPTVG